NELYMIKGYKKDDGILCLKFIGLKKKEKKKNIKYDLNLCYGSLKEMNMFLFEKFDLKESELILNLFDLIEMQPLKDVFYLTFLLIFKGLRSMFYKKLIIIVKIYSNIKINCNIFQ
ncbi:hypothetical protein RFI_36407, partial [Reticulomyxa filosa]